MKAFVITVLCAFVGYAAGGAIAWPGAIAVSSPVLRTVIPGETKTTAYSTTQYINAVPGTYSFAAHPQYTIQVPQVNSFPGLHPGYFQAAGHSFIPAGNVYYPSAPAFTPVLGSGFPSAPVYPSSPAYPGPAQPSPLSPQAPAPGDADSAVIDSAEFPPEQPRQPESGAMPSTPSQPQAPQPTQPAAPQFPPSNTFPNFPTIPQSPQEGEQPSFPQFPQIPGFPQFPPNGFPQGPSQSPPSSFPSAETGAMGLSDEDTVSVESA